MAKLIRKNHKNTKHPATSMHNYLPKLMKLQEEGTFKIGLTIVTVQHDNWCDYHKKKFCNCDPNLIVKPYVHS
jgi:hypothetical protein